MSGENIQRGRAQLAQALDAAGVRRGSARSVGMNEVASRMGLANADSLCERIGRGDLNADEVAARIGTRLGELTDAEINERASQDMAAVVAALLERAGSEPDAASADDTDNPPAAPPSEDPVDNAPPPPAPESSPGSSPEPPPAPAPVTDVDVHAVDDAFPPEALFPHATDDRPPEPAPRRIRVARAHRTGGAAPTPAGPPSLPMRRVVGVAAVCALAGGALAFIAAWVAFGSNAEQTVTGLRGGQITSESIAPAAVRADALAAEAITEGAIAPAAVSAGALADGAVDAPTKIGKGAVGPGALAAGSVDAGALGTGVVGLGALDKQVRAQLGSARVRSILRSVTFTGAEATISCQGPEVALAGGANAQRALLASAPVGTNGKPATGWRVRLLAPAPAPESADPPPAGGTLWVVCAR